MWPIHCQIRHNFGMAWSLAALVLLTVGVAALTRRQRGRRRGNDESPSLACRPESSKLPRAAEPAPEQQPPVKSCPACLAEYPPRNRYCVRDGAELIEGRSRGPFSQGMICPTCRRGYPIDASFCPEDADELVPYGLFGAASSTRPPVRPNARKICPECGVRHAPTHLFCGHDGAELVVVN